MMKSLYYVGFCLIVINAGAIIMNLISANEFSWSLIDRHVGFLMFGVFEMLYARERIHNKVLEELKDDFFVTILAIDNVCDEECAKNIHKEVGRLSFFMHVNPPKFFEWLDKKAREKASKKQNQ